TFPKRFKVAELFGALAALSSMRLKVNPTTLGVIMEQAVRGLKYVTHEDLANALSALHRVPRGTVNGNVVVAVVGSCKKALLDLGPESLAHLTAFMARQGYKPHPRFMGHLRGVLGMIKSSVYGFFMSLLPFCSHLLHPAGVEITHPLLVPVVRGAGQKIISFIHGKKNFAILLPFYVHLSCPTGVRTTPPLHGPTAMRAWHDQKLCLRILFTDFS
ncbi:hypothetical protein DUNSADRAFT_7210, partial [Dunaliella salina]